MLGPGWAQWRARGGWRGWRGVAATVAGSQPRVDRLGLQRENRENALVHPPQRLAAGDPVEGFQAEGVLAQGQRALVCQSALAQPGQVRRLGVVRPVDDAQVLTAAHLQARLPEPFRPADQVRGWLDDHVLAAGRG